MFRFRKMMGATVRSLRYILIIAVLLTAIGLLQMIRRTENDQLVSWSDKRPIDKLIAVIQNVLNFLHFWRRPSAKKPPMILAWTAYFDDNLSDMARNNAAHCRLKCRYTDNRSLITEAAAVLFHARNIRGNSDLPRVRFNWQRYVFFNQEPPSQTGAGIWELPKRFFNLTMTYRLDSDIIVPYDRFISINNSEELANLDNVTGTSESPHYNWSYVKQLAYSKTKLAALFVSNCKTSSKREEYVRELQKHMQVDIFGACSHQRCPSKSDCNAMLTRHYLFYLAFENSVCLDYVTEKFWRLKHLVVPVVLRADDYYRVAPADSFIAADRFESPVKLAEYLKELDANRSEYLRFFDWTKRYRSMEVYLDSGFCALCTVLHNESAPEKFYENIKVWWHEESKCVSNFAANLLS